MLRSITPQDKNAVCLFTAHVFCSHEPMCKALGATVPIWVQQFDPLIDACCSSGMSFMMESAGHDPNKIMSVSLALPYAQYVSVELENNPMFDPIIQLLDSLPDLPDTDASSQAVALNLVWGTHHSHMNKGYLRKVVQATMDAARQAGCSCIVADATNVVSQHLLPVFGFQPQSKVRYQDYECFRAISCTDYVIRAVKQLPASLEE